MFIKRTPWIVLAAGLFTVASLTTARWLGAEDVKITEKVLCPVSGRPAKADNHVKYKGRMVYFCCENCPKAFEADNAKHAAKANLQLVLTKQAVQVACPLSGKAFKKDKTADVMGVEVAFCCGNCQGKIEKSDDDAKLALVFAKLEKGFTVQTKCPVSGKPINAAVSLDHDGKAVYFCCEGCPAAFSKDPSKFAEKLN
jgi:YHS domain-containing protein